MNEHMCVSRFVQLLKGANVMASITFFVWLPYGTPHQEVNKSYGPKLFNLMHFSFHLSLSLTILGKFRCKNYSSRNAIKKLTP
jgi:hypothetical protein